MAFVSKPSWAVAANGLADERKEQRDYSLLLAGISVLIVALALTRLLGSDAEFDSFVVVYGFIGIKRSDPDYAAISVMNNALGQYAIGGKLGDSIRERQGMAYYVYSSLDATFGPGPFLIRAGVSDADVERTFESSDV